jgi:hypothetical protein
MLIHIIHIIVLLIFVGIKSAYPTVSLLSTTNGAQIQDVLDFIFAVPFQPVAACRTLNQ